MTQELRRITIEATEYPVVMDEEAGQFRVEANGHVALIEYKHHHGALALVHTEVPPAFKGQRVGDQLARAVLDYAREQQLPVEPYCPFVSAFIKRHHDYADLVAPGFVSPS